MRSRRQRINCWSLIALGAATVFVMVVGTPLSSGWWDLAIILAFFGGLLGVHLSEEAIAWDKDGHLLPQPTQSFGRKALNWLGGVLGGFGCTGLVVLAVLLLNLIGSTGTVGKAIVIGGLMVAYFGWLVFD